MLKIEAVIQPSKLADVKASLQDLGVTKIAISEVLIQAGPSAHKLYYRGAEYYACAPMMKLEMLVSSFCVDEVVEAIAQTARTGQFSDDGTILISEVADAMNIRSGERVEFILS